MISALSKFLSLNGAAAPYRPFSEFLGKSPGVFETMRFERSHGQFFCRGFKLHQKRFTESLRALQFDHLGAESLRAATAAALRQSAAPQHGAYKVRWFCSAEEWGVLTEPYVDSWGSATQSGIKTVLFKGQRLQPELKLLNAAVSLAAVRYAEKQHAHEALLVDGSGNLTEGAWSNFFWIDAGERIYTADSNVLPGISRQLLTESMHVAARDSSVDEILRDATEAFITQATRGVVPVTEIAGKLISHGRPGPIWAKARQLYLLAGQAEDSWL